MEAVDGLATRADGAWQIDGDKVRALRQRRRLSQPQLARDAAVSQATISAIENSPSYRARLATAAGLARVLGVDIRDLLADPVSADAMIQRLGVEERGGGAGAGAVPLIPFTVVGSVPAAAGTPKRAEGNVWVESALVSARSGRHVGVKIYDDSCAAADTPPGQYAVVNLDLDWTDGQWHWLEWQGEQVIRRVAVAANLIRVVDPWTTELSPFTDSRKVKLLGVVVAWSPGGARAAF